MDKYVQNCYLDYKKFMKQTNIPDIEPIFDVDGASIKNTVAYVENDDLRKSIIPIYISKDLFSYNEQYYKSKLFHEFTHIFDANVTFEKIYDEDELLKLMSSYSEYHASQIELLSLLKYKVISPIVKKFNLNTKIYEKNEYKTIQDYLLTPLVDALTILDKDRNAYTLLTDNEYNIKYVTAEKNIFYYLGKYRVCDVYADKKPHNFFHEFGVFENDVQNIYCSLKSKDFTNILNNTNNFMMHYLYYFLMPNISWFYLYKRRFHVELIRFYKNYINSTVPPNEGTNVIIFINST